LQESLSFDFVGDNFKCCKNCIVLKYVDVKSYNLRRFVVSMSST